MISSPGSVIPKLNAAVFEAFNISSVVLNISHFIGTTPKFKFNPRLTCSYGVIAMIGAFGLYLEINLAVEPLFVAATMALAFRRLAVLQAE